MTAENLVIIHVALALAAPLAAVVLEIAGRPRWGSIAAATALLAASAAGWYAAAVAEPAAAWLLAAAGGGYSAVPATIYLIAAIVLLASRSAVPSVSASQVTLIAFVAAAAGILASSLDIAIILLAAETMALAAYALVAGGHHPKAQTHAVRYFVQGAAASGLFVLGLAIVYGLAGSSTSLLALRAASLPAAPLLAGTLLMTVALAFKAGAAPFHAWAPDAYESASGPVSAFLSSGAKLASVAVVATLSAALFDGTSIDESRFVVFSVLAVASIFVGTIGGLAQRSYARMLGYSGIAQVGYALAAIAVGAGSAAVLLMATYAFGVAAAFLAASAWWARNPDWNGEIDGLAGMGARMPLVAAALAASVLSMIGLPPLLGFWGKLAVFGRVIDAGAIELALVGLLGAVISVGYYGRVLKAAYFADAPATPTVAVEQGDPALGSGRASGIAVVVLSMILVTGGLALIIAGLPWLQRLFLIA